uniref:Ras GTPase-activating protein-binding protein 1 n=1 Tax=Geotrypetes seraphini TaxID=260995 RepID=A0A6P8PGE0_GEOSA|nr:ras GTPase-activating protein-binding protein 1 [Geotrypetes seraphini]XP_033782993.1 ras GTPase-activating protein-binding protein 1 [Geotrypetes seraphini]XP_033782994.1 ras GTPase-activating protein-binding protein 1 [Geotrypetes seraphini]XP_033782995.1 ras GTPase-activating protein-binding protein 1 [Geotrypetes seraphini]
MVMEKPSPLLVGREFVRQYYTLLNQAPDYLHRFYGKSSSYVHGGLDPSGKPADAVYGQSEIHKKVMSMNFKDCHTKIRHVDAHATLNDGVVVQVMGELSNNRQPMRRFMQTFVLAPEGSVANKFYVHNDIFRYQDEVFDSDTEPPEEESDEEVDEPEERSQTPEVVGDVGDDAGTYYDTPGSVNDTDEQLEEQVAEPEPEPEPELDQDSEPIVQEEKSEPVLEEPAPEEEVAEKCSSPAPADPIPAVQEDSRTFSWASVTSKNLPPSGAVPVSGIPPHVVKIPVSQPRSEPKPESQTPPQRPPQRDQRVREQRPSVLPPRGPRPVREGEQGELDTRRVIRYPDSHQLFVGNLPHDVDKSELKEFFQTYGNVVELRINSGGKLPNFGFVVFDDPEPVQKILGNRPIMFRGDVRLNVEEKKTRAAREGERQNRPRGPGGPRGGLGGGIRGPPRGGMSQKPGFGAGRGIGGQRQ